MIIVYDEFGNEIGRYDSASDVWCDYPEAIIRGNKAFV